MRCLFDVSIPCYENSIFYTIILFRFHVSYILSKPSASWDGLRGRIDQSILNDFFSAKNISKKIESQSIKESPTIQHADSSQSGLDKLYAICGPDEFTKTMKR